MTPRSSWLAILAGDDAEADVPPPARGCLIETIPYRERAVFRWRRIDGDVCMGDRMPPRGTPSTRPSTDTRRDPRDARRGDCARPADAMSASTSAT